MTTPRDDRSILVFLGLTLALSAVWWTIIIATGHVGGGGGHYVEGLMWSPAIAAFATVALRRLNPQTLGLAWGGARYALLGYATPIAYALIAYVLVWTLGFGGFPNPDAIAKLSHKLGWSLSSPASFVVLYVLITGTTGMISSLSHALGEEIGWRGFLAPRMANRFGFTSGAIVTGVIWTAWHVPILLFADYNSGTPAWFALPCFAVMVVSISVMMTWIRLRSNSVWPCAILHASHNLFIQAVFTPLTTPKGEVTAYAIDEFGLAVPALALVFAVLFWVKRSAAEAGAGPAIAPAT